MENNAICYSEKPLQLYYNCFHRRLAVLRLQLFTITLSLEQGVQ